MMRKRNIIPILIAIIIIVAISITAFTLWKNSQTPPIETISQGQNSAGSDSNSNNNETPSPTPTSIARTTTELIDSITKQEPSLIDANQQPIFGITNTTKTASGWYVITIINKNDLTVGTAKIIMKDSGSAGVVLVAGPGTSFSRDSFTFPDDVWKLL